MKALKIKYSTTKVVTNISEADTSEDQLEVIPNSRAGWVITFYCSAMNVRIL